MPASLSLLRPRKGRVSQTKKGEPISSFSTFFSSSSSSSSSHSSSSYSPFFSTSSPTASQFFSSASVAPVATSKLTEYARKAACSLSAKSQNRGTSMSTCHHCLIQFTKKLLLYLLCTLRPGSVCFGPILLAPLAEVAPSGSHPWHCQPRGRH